MSPGSTTSLPRLAEIGVDRLRGVGPKHLDALHAIGIDCVLDLLTHYPRRYIDRTNQAQIADLVEGQEAMVLGQVRRSTARRGPARAARSSRWCSSTGPATCRSRFSISRGGSSSFLRARRSWCSGRSSASGGGRG